MINLLFFVRYLIIAYCSYSSSVYTIVVTMLQIIIQRFAQEIWLHVHICLPRERNEVRLVSCRDHRLPVVYAINEVLCYKSEGRWFDRSWCHWKFSLT